MLLNAGLEQQNTPIDTTGLSIGRCKAASSQQFVRTKAHAHAQFTHYAFGPRLVVVLFVDLKHITVGEDLTQRLLQDFHHRLI